MLKNTYVSVLFSALFRSVSSWTFIQGEGCCRILKYVLLKSLHDTVIRLLECLQLYFACTKCLERNFYQNGGKQLTFAWLKSGQNSNKNGNKSHFQNSVITLVFPPVFSRESLVENTNIYMYMYFNMFIICAKKRTRMFPSAGGSFCRSLWANIYNVSPQVSRVFW